MVAFHAGAMAQEIRGPRDMMARRSGLLAFAAATAVAIAVLNINVTTTQGVDYKVRRVKIPLYLKAFDFMDRYYNYGVLAARITGTIGTEEGKSIAILKWTKENIRENPESLPVIDDHAWHIIIRGYGTDDQFQDVFTTLCNRAGIGAYFNKISPAGGGKPRSFSFVRLKSGWTVFDAYRGIYFMNSSGKPAILADIEEGNWKAAAISSDAGEKDYGMYLAGLGSAGMVGWKNSRAAIQSPVRRFIFWLKGGKEEAGNHVK